MTLGPREFPPLEPLALSFTGPDVLRTMSAKKIQVTVDVDRKGTQSGSGMVVLGRSVVFGTLNTMAPSVPRSRQVRRVRLPTTNGAMNVSSRDHSNSQQRQPTTESPGHGADTELRESLSREV